MKHQTILCVQLAPTNASLALPPLPACPVLPVIIATQVPCLIATARSAILMMDPPQPANNATIVVKLVQIRIHVILVTILSTIEH